MDTTFRLVSSSTVSRIEASASTVGASSFRKPHFTPKRKRIFSGKRYPQVGY
jgi:hypothetical protein